MTTLTTFLRDVKKSIIDNIRLYNLYSEHELNNIANKKIKSVGRFAVLHDSCAIGEALACEFLSFDFSTDNMQYTDKLIVKRCYYNAVRAVNTATECLREVAYLREAYALCKKRLDGLKQTKNVRFDFSTMSVFVVDTCVMYAGGDCITN